MQKWNQILVEEHEWIERCIAVIEIEFDKKNSVEVDFNRILRALDFLFEIGDKIHNKKEEDFLFPLMESKGIPRDGGPIGVMLQEHQIERELLSQLMVLVMQRKPQQDILPELKQKCQAYFQIRKEHIWKENDVLYPMANRFFTPSDHERVTSGIQQIDSSVYGESARVKYASMVEETERSGKQGKLLIENLSYQQIHNIFETLPVEITFVDASDTVAYFNRLDKEKIFVRTRSVIGRKVEKCHPEKSVDKVLEIVSGFKAGTLDMAEFWINFMGKKVYIQYFPVRDDQGIYQGVLEITSDIAYIQSLQGEKRLL